MEKEIPKRIRKKVSIMMEIIMKMLNCSYAVAFEIVVDSLVYRSFLEDDPATLYQSAPCCIYDIGKELRAKGIPCARYFTLENIGRAVLRVREDNLKSKKKLAV